MCLADGKTSFLAGKKARPRKVAGIFDLEIRVSFRFGDARKWSVLYYTRPRRPVIRLRSPLFTMSLFHPLSRHYLVGLWRLREHSSSFSFYFSSLRIFESFPLSQHFADSKDIFWKNIRSLSPAFFFFSESWTCDECPGCLFLRSRRSAVRIREKYSGFQFVGAKNSVAEILGKSLI